MSFGRTKVGKAESLSDQSRSAAKSFFDRLTFTFNYSGFDDLNSVRPVINLWVKTSTWMVQVRCLSSWCKKCVTKVKYVQVSWSWYSFLLCYLFFEGCFSFAVRPEQTRYQEQSSERGKFAMKSFGFKGKWEKEGSEEGNKGWKSNPLISIAW